MIKVEYLLPFETKNGICKNIESFKSLIATHEDLYIEGDSIKFKDCDFGFKADLNEVLEQNLTVIHVLFESEEVSEGFREMLKSFRTVVGILLKDNLQLIWDGIGFELSQELYPKIYKIENLMRKLISKFMLINLGIGWCHSFVPEEVKENVKSPKGKVNHGILYEVDFIQLSNFLFKNYALKDAGNLPKIIDEILQGEMTDEKRSKILDYIPKNNWDRYFCDVVNCESEQLKKKWTRLYEIRCIVAHNKSINQLEFDDGNDLCEFLEKVLETAFDGLDSIEISELEKENVSLNTMATVHEPTKVFVNEYNNFNNGLNQLININEGVFNLSTIQASPISTILDSSLSGVLHISNSVRDSLYGIESAKNTILSGDSINSLYTATNNYEHFFKDAGVGLYNVEGINKTPSLYDIFIERSESKGDAE